MTRRYARRAPTIFELAAPPDTGGWRQHAACLGSADPTLWDQAVDGETRPEQEKRHALAMAVCSRCPVRAECLADAQAGVDEGVRGGVLLPSLTRHADIRAYRQAAS